jgi:hypothetical protein
MARFLSGPGISAIAQSTIGATFLQAGQTGILRVKKALSPVRDFYSLQNRAYFFRLLDAWQHVLNDTERADWLALGGTRRTIDVFGNPVPLSGCGTFIRYNLPRLQTGLDYNHTPPTDFTATVLIAFTVAATTSPQQIRLTALTPNIEAGETLVLACSVSHPAGYTTTKPRPRTMARIPGPVSLPFDFTAKWSQYGGLLLSGTTLLAKVRVMKDVSGFYGPTLAALVAVP